MIEVNAKRFLFPYPCSSDTILRSLQISETQKIKDKRKLLLLLGFY